MSLRQLLQKPIQISLFRHSATRNGRLRRFQSTSPKSTSPSNQVPPAETAKTRARADKVLNSLPGFLRKYTDGLKTAPITHVVAFLFLHEITAIVPLVGLAGFFHYSQWLPSYLSESEYISEGIEKFGRYFKRKGWFGFSKEDDDVTRSKTWNVSESGSRILVEVATAYAITKVLLPGRIVLSVWATPWFARVFVGKIRGGISRFWGSKRAR